MSKKLFSEADQILLLKNNYVSKISERSITFTDEFKRLFIEELMIGKLPREIFECHCLPVHIIGMTRVEQSADRWKKAYSRDGIIGLLDNRKGASGRPLQRELTSEEVIAKQEARINLLESQIELLKKLDKNERRLLLSGIKRSISVKFELIKNTVDKGFSRLTGYLCELLQVSRSGYYNYLASTNARLERAKRDEEAGKLVKKAFNRRGFKKGARSIKMVLKQDFKVTYSLKRISRLMKKFNLVCPHRKPNPYKRIAKATKEHRTLPNLLQRDFRKEIPGLVLLTDITYLPYGRSEMAYLSTLLDASTGEVLAYNLSDRITLDIATDTVDGLLKQRNVKLHTDAFIHSDQGSHYTSPVYQKLLRDHGLGQSMSRRGNCWDNAPQESFFGHMKDHVDHRSCSSFLELQRQVNRYIRYYNHHRYQWGRQKMTPVQYRNHLLSAS
ncbi:IS3 family transposase [Paenibacillus sp. FSL K6-2524]|uniref:IS3 family transposase n=1 Tax=Paenibacillus sp. FSL K6-2524 TaxID=2954516 RepID=UPI0030F84FDF